MKRIFQIVILAASMAALTACDKSTVSVSGGQQTPATQTKGMSAGNWNFSTVSSSVSSGSLSNVSYGGPLTVSSSTVSLVTTPSSGCILNSTNPVLTFTGTLTGNNLTLTSPAIPASSDVLTMTGTVRNGGNFDGVFQISGAASGDPCYEDAGTASGQLIPPLTGAWIGTINENGYSQYDAYGNPVSDATPILNSDPVIVNIVQADIPIKVASLYGIIEAFPLSGTVSFTNSNCYTAATIDSTKSFISGENFNLVIDTDTGGILTTGGSLDATHPQTLHLGTASSPILVQSGTCQYYQVIGTIDQQLHQ